MNASTLALVVIGQIAIFQFGAVAFTKSLFGVVLGPLPDRLDRESAAYLGSARRRRFILGGGLMVVALIGLLGIVPEPGARKLLLAGTSILSSGAFAYASVRDRRTLGTMRRALPGAGVRRAALRPRALSNWYHPGWEAVPIGIVLGTAALAVTFGQRLERIPTEMWMLLALQVAFVIGALFYGFRHGTAVPNVSARLAAARHRPELALAFGERLAATEMRYFMAAKTGVTLLLGVATVHVLLEALGHDAAARLATATWGIVAALIVLFAGFVAQVANTSRRLLAASADERMTATRENDPQHT